MLILSTLKKILQIRHPIYRFSQQSLSSTFKIRSKLGQFFKHTHPDILHNAPEKIKQENLRSIKNLNSYIDSISQTKPIEGKLLKFYVAQKSNNKSKKYYSFEVELPEITQTSFKTTEESNKLLGNIVEVLNRKFIESKMEKNPTFKKEMEKNIKLKEATQTQQERFSRLQQTVTPFEKKKTNIRTVFQKKFNQKITQAYINAQKQQLKSKLQKKVYFANTPKNKPMLWSRIALKQSGLFKDYQNTLQNMLDPKLMYFDQKLSNTQIDQFKTLLLSGQGSLREQLQKKDLYEVFLQMQKQQPPLCLYITTKYSGTQIPGFFSIPYNFNIKQLVKQFKILKNTIIDEKIKYEKLYDIYRQLKSELNKKNNIEIEFESFKNNEDITKKIIFLKRLLKYRLNNQILFIPFQKYDFTLFCEQFKFDFKKTCHFHNHKIVINIDFIEQDLQQLLQLI